MKTLLYTTLIAISIVCYVVAMTSVSHAREIDKSLVLYLPFDEGKGDEAKDASEYGHDGELISNPKWVDGVIGKALEFSGSNYVQVPITDELQLLEVFTAEFWVKRDAGQAATWNYMVAAGSLIWAVIYNTDQKVYIYSNSGGWGQRIFTDVPLTEDWTHIAATYDIKKEVKLYFNGEDAGTGAKPGATIQIDGSIMVGARHPGSEFFTGIIDEVALYNRILDLDEIKRDMEAVGGAAVFPKDKLTTTWGKIKEK
ncbi:LamG domain-containing protein [bacterium]|nr:LamG domain-containing protein [bacterium]